MTPTEALAPIQSQPLTLSTGQSLQDWLARETTLGPNRAPIAIREYQRFLALALSAAPGEITRPSPMAEQVWQRHLDDPEAWASFNTGLTAAKLSRHARRQDAALHAAQAASAQRYVTAFGPAPRPSWLARQRPGLIRMALGGAVLVLAYCTLKDFGIAKPGHLLPVIFFPGWLIYKAEGWLAPHPFRTYRPAPIAFVQSPKATP